MLDLKLDRTGATPKDAATIVLVRDGAPGLEVFCVERSKQSRFLGGAIVFPGGKLDEGDGSAAWDALTTPAPSADLRALAIAAARETLEEAAILFTNGLVEPSTLLTLRAALVGDPDALRTFLRDRGLLLDLAALKPFARWITPAAEARRYDARFFIAAAPANQPGAHDEHETMASFWATPADVLARFDRGEVQVAPPTHRTLEMLAGSPTAAAALAMETSFAPICPRLVQQGDTLALTLPGDPEHEVREPRLPGRSRYVLRGERWLAEAAP